VYSELSHTAFATASRGPCPVITPSRPRYHACSRLPSSKPPNAALLASLRQRKPLVPPFASCPVKLAYQRMQDKVSFDNYEKSGQLVNC
jgi:hypothetical protein